MKQGKKFIWFVFIGLVASGIGLYLTLPASPDEFPHPWNADLRQWHGLFTFLSLVSIGQMWAVHIRQQLKKWRIHLDGLVHLALWVGLILTGYLLYFPIEILSEFMDMGNLHWYLGLTLVVMMPFHVLLHIRKAAHRKAAKLNRVRVYNEGTRECLESVGD